MKQRAIRNPFNAMNSDVGSLFSRFPASQNTERYQEIQRRQAAAGALDRWPLLAEIQEFNFAAGEEDKK